MARFVKLTPMLQTKDIRATVAFYTGTLGFTLEGLWPAESPSWCMLSSGDARVMFMTNDHYGPPEMTGTLYIETDDVIAVHRSIEGNVPILWGPEVYPYGILEFAIKDVNGYTISFGQPDPKHGH
jgi:catechol 2,3-dioxygenase-like lactoylglutathione lyase family enzyme